MTKRAIVSVYDKTGLVDLARSLVALGWQLFSTGNTHRTLVDVGLPVTPISDLTGFPEILDGRVKTLHPKIHGGILARRDVPSHQMQLEEHGIAPVDLVVSNLYPFVETIAAPNVTPDEAMEHIDIGGPTMVRAAAKNHAHVLIVVDPADYAHVLDALRAASITPELRRCLARKAFEHTARYDAFVSQYFASLDAQTFPDTLSLPLTRSLDFTYGENPHQQGALYRLGDPRLNGPSLADMVQLQGDAISYNNLLDLDSAYAIVAEFDEPCVAIVKHNSPCGVGVAATITEAYEKAYAGDPQSAFGGVVAANRPVGGPMAKAMSGVLYWVVIALEITDRARETFKGRQTRLFTLPVPPRRRTPAILTSFALQYRPVLGGLLAQTPDAVPIEDIHFTVVSQRQPTERELHELRFAWRVVKHVRSNAAVFAKDGTVYGVGAGQQSRVDAIAAARRVAARAASERGLDPARPAEGCVMATDGFFAFPDAVEEAIEAGATAIAHPGGSRQGEEAAVAAADKHDVAMVTTGIRHFRH